MTLKQIVKWIIDDFKSDVDGVKRAYHRVKNGGNLFPQSYTDRLDREIKEFTFAGFLHENKSYLTVAVFFFLLGIIYGEWSMGTHCNNFILEHYVNQTEILIDSALSNYKFNFT